MYLISAYFDEKTNQKIQQYMDAVAGKTGNTSMLDGKVPPHITIASFETAQEDEAIAVLDAVAEKTSAGRIQWVTVGAFLPYVIYLAPVLNTYLHELSVKVNAGVRAIEEVKLSRYYQPFQWMPHTTIGKKLSQEELGQAFTVMQKQFAPFEGTVTKIGLAKTNPYRDIKVLGFTGTTSVTSCPAE